MSGVRETGGKRPGRLAPMSDESLRRRLEELEARQRLNEATDQALELAQRDRLPLDQTIRSVLPLLASHTRAHHVWLRTFDESLVLRDFTLGASDSFPLDGDAITDVTDTGKSLQRTAEGFFVIAQPLDVAGELFGAAGLAFEASEMEPERIRLIATLLDTWCEELDNYLAAIAMMRRKHAITTAISEALRTPLIDDGVMNAVDVLRENVSFDDMLLVFRHHEDPRGASLHYVIIQDGVTTHDSAHPDMEVENFIRDHASELLQGDAKELLARFNIERGREEVLISGVRNAQVLGRVVITSARGEFNTFDRDLLERFADFLRQRVVDFTKEWKALSLTFAPQITRRLLTHED